MDVGRLFEKEHERLYQYLVRFTGDGELAADAMQEAFLRALERPPSRRDDPRAWVYTVATNCARHVLRNRARRHGLLRVHRQATPTATPAPPPDEGVEREEARAMVRAALLELSEKDRTVLLMWDEGFKQREIGTAVGIPTGSVGTVLARAMKKLSARCNAHAGG